MSGYREILVSYLRQIGQIDAPHLGESNIISPVPQEQLVKELRRQYERNQILIWTAAALWIVLFGVGIYFAFHHRDNLGSLSVILGGNLLSLSIVMIALRQLWLDSSVLAVLLAILPGLSPEEGAKAIALFYFNAISRKGALGVYTMTTGKAVGELESKGER